MTAKPEAPPVEVRSNTRRYWRWASIVLVAIIAVGAVVVAATVKPEIATKLTAGVNVDILALVASVVAIIVSGFALTLHRRLEHETSAQTLIHAQYELCRALDVLRVQNPEVSHVLALPVVNTKSADTWRNYELFRKQTRALLTANGPAVTEAMRSRLYLQEHATALHVADIYEQTREQHKLAKVAGDTRRRDVLKALMDYYEKRMLRNPRLRFHWDHGVSDMMEEETRTQYNANVRAKTDDYKDGASPLEDEKPVKLPVKEEDVRLDPVPVAQSSKSVPLPSVSSAQLPA